MFLITSLRSKFSFLRSSIYFCSSSTYLLFWFWSWRRYPVWFSSALAIASSYLCWRTWIYDLTFLTSVCFWDSLASRSVISSRWFCRSFPFIDICDLSSLIYFSYLELLSWSLSLKSSRSFLFWYCSSFARASDFSSLVISCSFSWSFSCSFWCKFEF